MIKGSRLTRNTNSYSLFSDDKKRYEKKNKNFWIPSKWACDVSSVGAAGSTCSLVFSTMKSTLALWGRTETKTEALVIGFSASWTLSYLENSAMCHKAAAVASVVVAAFIMQFGSTRKVSDCLFLVFCLGVEGGGGGRGGNPKWILCGRKPLLAQISLSRVNRLCLRWSSAAVNINCSSSSIPQQCELLSFLQRRSGEEPVPAPKPQFYGWQEGATGSILMVDTEVAPDTPPPGSKLFLYFFKLRTNCRDSFFFFTVFFFSPQPVLFAG